MRIFARLLRSYDDERAFYVAHGRYPNAAENQRLRAARKARNR